MKCHNLQFVCQKIAFLSSLLSVHIFSVWLGFQCRPECTLQSLYLMCREKADHKSELHSSVFLGGSLNQSGDEKADTPLFGRLQNGSYLALDASDSRLIHQAVSSAPGAGETFSCCMRSAFSSGALWSVRVRTRCVQYATWCWRVHRQIPEDDSARKGGVSRSNRVKWGHHVCFYMLITSRDFLFPFLT